MSKDLKPSMQPFKLLDAIRQLRDEIEQAQQDLVVKGRKPLLYLMEGELELQLEAVQSDALEAKAGGEAKTTWLLAVVGLKAKAGAEVAGRSQGQHRATHTIRLKFRAGEQGTGTRMTFGAEVPPGPSSGLPVGETQRR